MAIISLIMVFSVVGIPASYAEKGDPVGIIDLGNGDEIRHIWYNYGDEEQDQIDGVSFDKATCTITFTNFKSDEALSLYAADKVNIMLKGTNYLSDIELNESHVYIDGDNNSTLILNQERNGSAIEVANASSLKVSKNVNFYAYGDSQDHLLARGTATYYSNLKAGIVFDAEPDKIDQEGTVIYTGAAEKFAYAINKYITRGATYSLKDDVSSDKYKKNIAIVPEYNEENELIGNEIYEKICDDAPFYKKERDQYFNLTNETGKEKYNTFIDNYNKESDINDENEIYDSYSVDDTLGLYKEHNNDEERYVLYEDPYGYENTSHFYQKVSVDGYTCIDMTKISNTHDLEIVKVPMERYNANYYADEISVPAVVSEQPKEDTAKPEESKNDQTAAQENTAAADHNAPKTADNSESVNPEGTSKTSETPEKPAQQNIQKPVQNHPKVSKPVKPGKVGRLTFTNKKKKIKISWKKVKNAKKYEIAYKRKGTYYKKTKKGKKQKVSYQWIIKTVKGTSITLKNLKKNKKYSFRVRAINGSKKGKWSKTQTIKAK